LFKKNVAPIQTAENSIPDECVLRLNSAAQRVPGFAACSRNAWLP
jgi:hypothetical protein